MDEPDNDVDEMTNEVDEMDNEGGEMNNEMDESNNESEEMDASSANSDAFDITKINVNFLGEWYAVMIDWNAAYEYKQQQVIQQLAQITGIPVELTTGFTVHELHPRGRVIEDWNDIRCIEIENDVLYKIRPVKNFHCPDKFTRRNMLGPCIAEDELYYLAFTIVFEPYFIYRTAVSYELVPQVEVVEGECNLHMCQTACTEPFFNRIRSILANCKLNKELSTRIMPLFNDGGDWEEEAKEVYYECNILPFFDVVCSYRFSEENLSGNNLMDHD